MDTHNSGVAEIPNFKLAKVGKDRERKRGGAGWLGARGAGSGFTGAVGGSGAAGVAGMGAVKTLIGLAIAASVSAGAWQFGRSFNPSVSAKAKPAVKRVFDSKDAQYADTSGVIKTETTIPNSMGYVSGSLDGMTPEERAKKQAEEEAARVAEEAAAKKAADEQAKQDAAAPPASTAMDPATIASAMGGGKDKKALEAGKFGKLGSSLGGGLGGGLSGGSGLSGGINRNFGGGPELQAPKIKAGSMSAFRSPGKPGYTSGARAVTGTSKSKSFAKRQLDNAFAQSRQAMSAGKTENAAATAASAFDNNPGQGNVIAGPGLNNGAHQGTADGGTPNAPENSGGPLNSDSGAACPSGQAPDINGNCQNINTSGTHKGADYQWMVTLAEVLLGVIAVLALICAFAKDLGITYEYACIIAKIIGVLGAAVSLLGIMILAASGDKIMGGILTGIGALVATVAFVWPETLTGPAPQVATKAAPMQFSAVGQHMFGFSKLSLLAW